MMSDKEARRKRQQLMTKVAKTNRAPNVPSYWRKRRELHHLIAEIVAANRADDARPEKR